MTAARRDRHAPYKPFAQSPTRFDLGLRVEAGSSTGLSNTMRCVPRCERNRCRRCHWAVSRRLCIASPSAASSVAALLDQFHRPSRSGVHVTRRTEHQ
jgi:hypothetical protein